MFSTWTFVHLSVRYSLFVCPFVVRLLQTYERYTWKTNKPISMQIGMHKFIRGKGMNDRPRGQEVKNQCHRRPKLCLETWQRHHSRFLESMQCATEMLPLTFDLMTPRSIVPALAPGKIYANLH